MSVSTVLSTAHHIGIVVAALLMATAMTAAAIHRLRIRCPILVVRSGPLGGVPLSPLLFLVIVAAGLTVAWIMEQPVHPAVAVGYLAIGGFWFGALWNVQPTVITEYGIVPDVHRMGTAVPWGRIVDYSISRTDSGGAHIMLLYRVDTQASPARLDIDVPEGQQEILTKLMRYKLDTRFMFSVQKASQHHPSEQ